MNKKFLSAVLFGALMVSSTGTFVSCKDYDDDIDQINNTLTDLKSQIAALQTEVEGGNWVTDLVDVEGGFKVTFNNGKTYTIVNGKDGDKGETGAAGAAGDKLTIDEATGEWKINDKATGCSPTRKIRQQKCIYLRSKVDIGTSTTLKRKNTNSQTTKLMVQLMQ